MKSYKPLTGAVFGVLAAEPANGIAQALTHAHGGASYLLAACIGIVSGVVGVYFGLMWEKR